MTSIQQIDDIKSSIVSEDTLPRSESSCITHCQVCGWYGYPQEKIIIELEGIRPEEEDGFIEIFTEYGCDPETGQNGNRHIHKRDPQLVQYAVDFALNIRSKVGNPK